MCQGSVSAPNRASSLSPLPVPCTAPWPSLGVMALAGAAIPPPSLEESGLLAEVLGQSEQLSLPGFALEELIHDAVGISAPCVVAGHGSKVMPVSSMAWGAAGICRKRRSLALPFLPASSSWAAAMP